MADTLAYSDITTALRETYQGGSTDDLLAKKHPLTGLIKRERDFADSKMRVPVVYAGYSGVATNMADAITNASSAKTTAFEVTLAEVFQVANVEGRLIEQAALGNGAKFLKQIVKGIDGSMATVGNTIAKRNYRNTGGSIGTVGSGTASPITMAYPEQADCLEVGMTLLFNDGENATTPRSTTVVITDIDHNTGVITFSGTATALAVGDFVFIDSFEGAASAGLEGWCPASAPSATTYFGVDRTSNSMLGGTRIDCSTFGSEEVFATVRARASFLPVQPDAWFINPYDLASLEVSVASAKTVRMESESYNFGYDALSVYGDKLIPDPDCQRGVLWGVPFEHFVMFSVGDAPKLLNADGNDILRSATADSYQCRVGARYNTYCDAPGLIVRAALS